MEAALPSPEREVARPAKRDLWLGECLRWYLTRARHPFKGYVVGHYWSWFSRLHVWVPYDGGGAIGVTLGDYVQQRIFFEGYYERPLVDWLKETLRPSDVFWDVGANIGAISLVAARLCRQVVAFEPDPRSLLALHRNLAANGIGNVEVIPAALGAEAGTSTLYQSATPNTGMTSLMAGRGTVVGETTVAVMRGDDLTHARPDLSPTIVKIDVEGAEHLVLGGSAALLQSGRVRALVFEDQRGADSRPRNAELVARLNEAQYRIEPFGPSDAGVDDGLYNFLARPTVSG